MLYIILFIFLFVFLCNILYLIRYYDLKIIFFWILAMKHKIKNIKYITTLNIYKIKKVLQLKTKGNFIEYYVATPAWKPVISLESCDNVELVPFKEKELAFTFLLHDNPPYNTKQPVE